MLWLNFKKMLVNGTTDPIIYHWISRDKQYINAVHMVQIAPLFYNFANCKKAKHWEIKWLNCSKGKTVTIICTDVAYIPLQNWPYKWQKVIAAFELFLFEISRIMNNRCTHCLWETRVSGCTISSLYMKLYVSIYGTRECNIASLCLTQVTQAHVCGWYCLVKVAHATQWWELLV